MPTAGPWRWSTTTPSSACSSAAWRNSTSGPTGSDGRDRGSTVEGAAMRSVIVMMSVSLDGFIEGPNGELDWHMVDDELHSHFNEQLGAMGAFLYGRVDLALGGADIA